MKPELKTILRPALILMAICLVVTAALAGANEWTKGPIAEQEAAAEQAARTEVLPAASAFRTIDGTENVWIGLNGSDTVGYVIITQSNGYGGALRVMTGISADGAVTGVSILSNNETVGLGANCVKSGFRAQFGTTLPENGFSVYKNGGNVPAEGGVEALTGATITSNAVVRAVNEAADIYRSITGSAEGSVQNGSEK